MHYLCSLSVYSRHQVNEVVYNGNVKIIYKKGNMEGNYKALDPVYYQRRAHLTLMFLVTKRKNCLSQ